MMGPFKGIRDRPYHQGTLENVDWYDSSVAPFCVIKLSELWLTQKRLSIPALFEEESYSTDPYPRVVVFEKEYYLEDGHHRVILGALKERPLTNFFRVYYMPERISCVYHTDCANETP